MKKNILDTPVEELPIRAEGVYELKERGFDTLRDVLQLSKRVLRMFRGIGNSTILKLELLLEKNGLSWGTIDNALGLSETPEPTTTPDNDLWEQRRYELAKAALIGLSGKAMKAEVAAVEAVVYADAVIEELKKQKHEKEGIQEKE